MAESKVPNTPAADKKNPNRTGKVCEFLTYSGREAFKRLRTNVLISLGDKTDKRGQIIGITSAQPSEGKSTVSVNLAYTLAELGKTALLIDCDMRRPAIHDIVSVKLTPGLADVLDGGIALNDAVSRYTSSADKTFFDLIPGGTIPEDPVEKLNSGRFQKLLDAAANAFDYVVLDLPPVNAVVDPAFQAGQTIRLTGSQAEKFVRARMVLENDTNLARMKRQRAYMDSFQACVRAAINTDSEFTMKLLEKLGDFLESDMTAQQLSDLVTRLDKGTVSPIRYADGELLLGEKYYEFYPDEASLWSVVKAACCE